MAKRKDKHQERVDRGNRQLADDQKQKEFGNDWNLGWFKPEGLQKDCVYGMDHCTFTIIDAPSGCGKTTTALWAGLMALKEREFNQLIFIKNPTEVGDDKIGFLSGDEQDKLAAHLDTTKRIFHTFMSKNKLECDIKSDKIRLTIPNFVLGSTWDNAFIILDESQLMSPATMKLLLERCGKNSKYVVLGDSGQRYAVTKRSDGFNDLIERITYQPDSIHLRQSRYPTSFAYIKMSRHDNQRSEGSKLINELYEDL